MGTRSGDLDPAIVPFLMHKLNCDWETMDKLLNKKSGLLGLSGISNDMRDLVEKKNAGNDCVKIVYDVFIYKIVKYVGAYYAAINAKLDAIIFTAGIGENSIDVRRDICNRLKYFGVKLDNERNNVISNILCLIIANDSFIDVYVIFIDEELLMARDTFEIYKKINS